MTASVIGKAGQCRLTGWADQDVANRFLDHLAGRAFAAATVRAYAFDVLCFARFCQHRGLRLTDVVPVDVFDWVAWQTEGVRPRSGSVVAMVRHAGAAPASVNRRVAAVRALFEYLVMCGDRADNPVPAPRRGQGLRVKSRGVLGHLGPGRPRGGGRLVQSPRRLPESLDRDEVGAFVADLLTHRDRAIALLMLLGGLRAGEVRGLRLADVDVALRRVRVVGKGGRERVVPVDRASIRLSAPCLPMPGTLTRARDRHRTTELSGHPRPTTPCHLDRHRHRPGHHQTSRPTTLHPALTSIGASTV